MGNGREKKEIREKIRQISNNSRDGQKKSNDSDCEGEKKERKIHIVTKVLLLLSTIY